MLGNIDKRLLYLLVGLMMLFLIFALLDLSSILRNDEGYTSISTQDSINSSVIYIERIRGGAKFDLEDGRKFIVPFARNYEYQWPELQDRIKVGGRILKRSNSDTILVTHYGYKYVFVLGIEINKE